MKLLSAYKVVFGLTLFTPSIHALAQVSSQPSGGDIDFTTYSSFASFRTCLKTIFAPYLQYGMTVPGENVGCIMNECLCQPQNIASNEPMLYTQASRECSNTKDAISATDILDGYCDSLGFTEREGVKAASTGGGGSGGATKPKETLAAITTTERITKTAANGAIVTETSVVVIEGTPSNDNPTTPASASDKKKDDLSVGAIIGIVTGIVGALAGCVAAYYTVKSHKGKKEKERLAAGRLHPEQVGMMERGVVYSPPSPPVANPGYGYGYGNGAYR